MYATCLFCQHSLGRNESIESFPIGRRLAFDAHRGRLWVVCRRCERWNLSPLEIRWEAIEECERTFRTTRLRVSTDNIGLARVVEGLELVRIGNPLHPEIAAWRYGDQFGRRRRRAMVVTGVGLLAVAGVVGGATAAGLSFGSFAGVWQLPHVLANQRVLARVRAGDGRILKVRGADIRRSTLARGEDGTLELTLNHRGLRPEIFRGDDVTRVTGLIMPAVNRGGGSRRTVQDAVAVLEQWGSTRACLHRLTSASTRSSALPLSPKPLARIPAPTRLAAEMALHEEQERRAIEEDLAVLEAAWREAEDVASIADNLFVPETVERQLNELREARASRPRK